MPRRGGGLVWWRRWRSVEGAVAQEGARRSLPGDGPVRSAEEALTRGVPAAQWMGGASASARRVNAAAVQLLCRRRVVRRGGEGGEGCWGRAGACGGGEAGRR